ncbi:RfbD dTDP-4-dehydrorhamnose reductase [Candidatus Nanopelagicaceae bacterium]
MLSVGILGSTGMLGSALSRQLHDDGFQVFEFNRSGISVLDGRRIEILDISEETTAENLEVLDVCDFILNSAGYIRQLIDEDDIDSIQKAHQLNSYFPQLLNDYSVSKGKPVIQIGTDCLFSGREGGYSENSEFEYTDLYSFTKLVGEILSPNAMTLRTSVIGRELNTKNSLMEWVLSQPQKAAIKGYTNHIWNGVTTKHFSKVVSGVLKSESFKEGVFHLVPSDTISKFELVSLISTLFGRDDLEIIPTKTIESINRVLTTSNPEANSKLWSDAGFDQVLTIPKMLQEYAETNPFSNE